MEYYLKHNIDALSDDKARLEMRKELKTAALTHNEDNANKRKKDFKAYLTFRCINKRSTLDKPELEHMTSNEFCMESWKEKNA